jgi:hypothetical protein
MLVRVKQNVCLCNMWDAVSKICMARRIVQLLATKTKPTFKNRYFRQSYASDSNLLGSEMDGCIERNSYSTNLAPSVFTEQ